MRFRARKTFVKPKEESKISKKKIALLITSGVLLLGGGKVAYDVRNDYKKASKLEEMINKYGQEYFLENPELRLEERLKQIEELEKKYDVEQSVPEYVNEYGVEITKEEWENIEKEKEKEKEKENKRKQIDDEYER